MERWAPDAHQPRLRVRIPGEEPVGSGQDIVGHLERAGFDIDGNDSASMFALDQRPDLAVVELSATARELLIAVARTSASHHALPAYLVY
jgi:hypothetical protein